MMEEVQFPAAYRPDIGFPFAESARPNSSVRIPPLVPSGDFEVFRGPLIAALRRGPRNKGGRPPFDPVAMFKILVPQALYSLSDEATEFQIKDRLSFRNRPIVTAVFGP